MTNLRTQPPRRSNGRSDHGSTALVLAPAELEAMVEGLASVVLASVALVVAAVAAEEALVVSVSVEKVVVAVAVAVAVVLVACY